MTRRPRRQHPPVGAQINSDTDEGCGRLNEQVCGSDHDPGNERKYARTQQKVGDDGHGTLPIHRPPLTPRA